MEILVPIQTLTLKDNVLASMDWMSGNLRLKNAATGRFFSCRVDTVSEEIAHITIATSFEGRRTRADLSHLKYVKEAMLALNFKTLHYQRDHGSPISIIELIANDA
jgi:hypothetical protein